jgi:glycosyltransferase involved in cell wall biosynthesis
MHALRRLLFVSTNPAPWGGSEDMWHELALRSLKDGHMVMVSVFRHPRQHPKIKALEEAGAQLHYRRLPAYYDEQPFAAWVIAHLKLRLQWDRLPFTWSTAVSFRPDQIFISGGETLDGCMFQETYLIRQAVARQIPYAVVGHFHHEYSKVLNKADRVSKRNYLRQASGCYFVSHRNWHTTANEIQDKLTDARVLFNPIRDIPERKWKISADGPIRMAFVARLEVAIKCQDLAINVLAQDEFKNTDFVLDLFGEGPDKSFLEDLIQFHGLEQKVRLMGQHSSPGQIWEDHDLLVLTSRGEGAPLVILEAMRAGIPCLVTRAGDSALWINDQWGYIAESIAVEALTQAFVNAFQDRSNWGLKGERCRRFFEAAWTSEHMEQLYRILCGEEIKAGIPAPLLPEWMEKAATEKSSQ